MKSRTTTANQSRLPFLVACSLLLVVAAGPCFAQQATRTAAEDHALIEQLLKRVAELERDVRSLRGADPAHSDPSIAAAPTTQPQASAEAHETAMAGGSASLRIRGFGNIDFHGAQTGDDAPNTFTVGPIDLFLSSRISDRFSTVGEIVFEPDEHNQWGIDTERMLLQFSANDYFNLAAGRYHTSIGYYNAAYHHGTWFQTATGRPFIFNFEDDSGLLPIHGIGVTASGRIPSGSLGLRYVAEISNGRSSRSKEDEPVQNQFDENRHKAVNLAALIRPDWILGLQAGFSVYRDRLTPAGRAAVAETIMATHVVYQTPVFELLNEALFIRHAPEHGVRATTTGTFYSQISQQFGRFRPYARFEYIDVPETDAIFGDDLGRLHGPSFGLRFDAADPIALKVQFNRLFGRARDRTNGLTTQLAFTF